MSKPEHNIESIYPLSPLQQGILFETLLAPESAAYVCQRVFTLRGEVQAPVLHEAWQRAVRRHAALRTLFVWKDKEKPLQVVCRKVDLPWHFEDWRTFSAGEQEAKLEELLSSDRRQGFDLSQAPLLRLRLLRRAEDRHDLVLTVHHLLLDGWSAHLVLREVTEWYDALCAGRDCPLDRVRPYQDYIRWLQRQDLAKAETYWRGALDGFSAPTPLGMSLSGRIDAGPRQGIAEQNLELPAETSDRWKAFCRRHELTLNTLLQGAWALLLARHAGSEDVLFGSVVAGRPAELSGVESMVGMFINTLPVRARFSPGDSVLSWLRSFQSQLAEVRQYEHSPLVQVHGWSQAPRGGPLFESLFVFENYPVDRSSRREGGLRMATTRVIDTTNYPLTVAVMPREKLGVLVSYDRARFDEASIARLLGHLTTLLEGIAAEPACPIKDLPILTAAERRQLLVDWNNARSGYPRDRGIHELFEVRAEQWPDATAVVFEDRRLTYRELNERANQVAHHLRRLGVGPEVPVGICLERSLEMVVGVVGILKAGGAYVPLDPAYPAERLGFMLSDSGCKVLLTRQALAALFPACPVNFVFVDRDGKTIAQESRENPPSAASAESLAYVIYTSGSTGKPKGVCVPHRGVVRLVSQTNYVTFSPDDVFLQFAPLAFDASTFEIWAALLNGARLVVFPPHLPSLEELGKALQHQAVTTLWLTAGLFHEMVDHQLDRLRGVRQLLAGGDVLSPAHVRKFLQEVPECTLVNGYGPTENTTFSCCHPMRGASSLEATVPIGKPIAHSQCYVLDGHLRLVPTGVPGELYLGGDGLARGYLNRPELTAERFLSHPFDDDPAARVYKTGDLVRWLPDGNLEFLGRLDQQVKIRGFRIELGEIETCLRNHPGIQDVVVAAREDLSSGKRLVAYFVAKAGAAPAAADLRHHVKQSLPDYMAPAAFVALEALPLTPNGKVDRRALPAPDAGQSDSEHEYSAPRTPTELITSQIWTRILGLERVGIHENFFDLGGNSLLAARAVDRLQKAVGKPLPLAAIFREPTIAGLARLVTSGNESSFDLLEPIRPAGNQSVVLCFGGALMERRPQIVPSSHPLYWCKPEYVEGKGSRFSKIEDMAAHYCRQISAAGLKGPYVLCGFSVAGLIAFETARQLHQRDGATTLLFLLEPTPPGMAEVRKGSSAASLFGRFRAARTSSPSGSHPSLRQQAPGIVQDLRQWLRFKYHGARLAVGRPLPVDLRWQHAEGAYRRAAKRYVPRPFPGKVVLVMAKGWAADDYLEQWAQVAQGGLTLHELPLSDHLDFINDEQAVALWTDLLRQHLTSPIESIAV